MKITDSKPNSPILTTLWIVLIIFALFSSVLYISGLDLRSGEQWSDYYSLYTDNSDSIEAVLLDKDIPFLSFSTSKVQYNDISEMKSISLSQISGRFTPFDPRLDPYIKNVSHLFQARGEEDSTYEIIYIEKTALPLLTLYLYIRQNISSDKVFWVISGFEPFRIYTPLVLFIIFCTFIIFSSPEGSRMKGALAFLGWMPLIYLYGFPGLLISILFIYFFLTIDSLKVIPLLILLSGFFVFRYQELNSRFLVFFVMGLFASSLILFSRKSSLRGGKAKRTAKGRKWNKISFRKPDHELFSPVTIMASRPVLIPDAGNKGFLKFFTVFFIFVISGLSLFRSQPPSFTVPLPVGHSEKEWILTSTENGGAATSLISAADYITHVAFQEGFLYGSRWDFPDPEYPLRYPVYTAEEKTFSKSYEIIADYSEKWFESKISILKNDNPAKLLFSTDYPSSVIKKLNHQKYHSFTLLNFSFSVLLLLLIIFGSGNKSGKISFNVRKKLLRRNEQVA